MIDSKKLAKYIDHGLNILISGPAGTGKTTALMDACKSLGINMKYYSASTLDPYIDLVGIPEIVDGADGERELRMVRKKEMDNVEVLFFDEANRSEVKTQNALLELTQFGTINGEKLPKLKAVVAAINPASDDNYNGTTELDLAFRDRFQLYFVTENVASLEYFVGKFGEFIGPALVKWHKENDHKNCYVSLRRLEEIGRAWVAFREKAVLEALMPLDNGSAPNVDDLYENLQSAQRKIDGATIVFADRIADMPVEQIRARRVREELLDNLDSMSTSDLSNVRDRIAVALNLRVSPGTIVDDWFPFVEGFTDAQMTLMQEGWAAPKKNKLKFLLDKRRKHSAAESEQ